MQSFFAITLLTLKLALRQRLIVVLAVLLLGTVVILPLMIRDDGTAQGFTQIILTYTLTLATAILGLATLWLACGTMARDIEDCQMQMVVVKPVPRWQIWLGKWAGIMLMNALLLSMVGVAVYGLMLWRSGSLSEEQREILRNEVLVARGSSRMVATDIEPMVEELLTERMKDQQVAEMDRGFVRDQIREQIRAYQQIVPPGLARTWRVNLGAARHSLQDQPIYLRVKFYVPPEESTTLNPNTYLSLWEIGPPGTPNVHRMPAMKQAAETFHQIEIPPNLFDQEGVLTVNFHNRNPIALLFRIEDGLEVLYREGGFAMNFMRGLGVICCWLGLLAAVGLASASFLSFPVAAFCCAGILVVAFSGGILSSVVEQGMVFAPDHEGNFGPLGWLNPLMLPVFHFLFRTVHTALQFSPIDLMSTGRSITWGMLASAVGWIILCMGGVFAAFGMIVFTRRELASTSNQL